MFVAYARAFIACCLLVVAVAVEASAQTSQQINPAGELTLARAVDAALNNNPDLRASAFELSAAQARIVQAGVRPNPELSVELENFAGSGGLNGADVLETTLSLGQVIELGGKRDSRRNVAEAHLDAVTTDRRARELDVLAEVARRFIDVIAAQERVRLALEATSLAEQMLTTIDERVDAARSPAAERSRARIAVTRARLEQRRSEGALRSARYALSATWGSPEPAFKVARAELFELRSIASPAALLARLDASPNFIRFASERRVREAELRLARAQARPDLSFTIGARRFEESSDTALVAGFSMPLPLHDRNQGAIREAQVRLTQTDAEFDAVRLQTRAVLLGLYEELQTARASVDSLRAEALPQAQLVVDQTRSGYERGRFSLFELLSAMDELRAVGAAAIDAAAEYHRTLTELERLTGAAFMEQTP